MKNQKIIFFVVIFLMCMIGITSFEKTYGAQLGDWVYTCDHNNFDYTRGYYIDATCVSYGRSVFFCKEKINENGWEKGCPGRAIYYQNDMVSHVFGLRGSVTKHEPTCTEKGYTEISCILCWQYLIEDEVPPLGHQITTTIDIPATCTEAGRFKRECTRPGCGVVFKDEVRPATGHNYEETVVEPTCMADGYVCDRCTKCGDIIAQSKEIIPHTSSDHIYTWFVAEKAPTCQEDGYIIRRCSVCRDPDAKWTFTIMHDPDKDHVLPKEPIGHYDVNCEDNGYDVFECKVCHKEVEVETETAYGLPHNYVEIERVNPTCTSSGYILEECQKFDCHTMNETILSALGHKDNDKDDYCDVCGAELDWSMEDE